MLRKGRKKKDASLNVPNETNARMYSEKRHQMAPTYVRDNQDAIGLTLKPEAPKELASFDK